MSHPFRFLLTLTLSLLLLSPAKAGTDYISLCYHDVRYDVVPVVDRDGTALGIKELAEHFSWLRENAYTPVSLAQLEAAEQGRGTLPEKPVLLTFDDGYASFYDRIYPLLREFNYPAVYAVVTSWLETPANEQVLYGDEYRPRSDFLSWAQVREMLASGLIEIASHSHDMHKAHASNPAGSLRPLATSLGFDSVRGYETEGEYQARIYQDLALSHSIITERTGVAPRAIVWPYGSWNAEAVRQAKKAGLSISLTLDDGPASSASTANIPRILVGGNPNMRELSWNIRNIDEPKAQRGIFVSLEDYYDEDPVRQHELVSQLLDTIRVMNLSHVYLSPAVDDDGDGNYDRTFFPNAALPIKADLFDWVSWALKTRARVEVMAWVEPALLGNVGDELAQREFFKRLGMHSAVRGVVHDSRTQGGELLALDDSPYTGLFHYLKAPSLIESVSPNELTAIIDNQPTKLGRYRQLLFPLGPGDIPRAAIQSLNLLPLSPTPDDLHMGQQYIFSVPASTTAGSDVSAGKLSRQLRSLRALGVRNLAIHGHRASTMALDDTLDVGIRRNLSLNANPHQPN